MRDRWRGRPRTEEEPTDDAGDADLVVRARCDPGAYEELFRRYWSAVLRYCYYRLGRWEEAEDAAGEVFANAFAAHAGFAVRNGDVAGSFRSWLFWIAHNEVVSARRKRARRTELPLDGLDSFADRAPSRKSLRSRRMRTIAPMPCSSTCRSRCTGSRPGSARWRTR